MLLRAPAHVFNNKWSMNKSVFLSSSLCLALGSASFTALAAGFQVSEHSANGLGRAFAGQAAMPENASVLATNPAAIGQFDAPQLSGALNLILPDVDINGELQTQVGEASIPQTANEDDIADTAVIPSLFYVTPVNEKVSAGIGFFANYGLASDYSDDFNALHFADRAEIITFTINPAMSYSLTESLDVGLGLSATYSEAEISTATPKAIEAVSQGAIPGNAEILRLEGDDWGYGWNVGLFWQATDATDIALSYRAETQLELEGEVSSELFPALNQAGSLELNLAAIAELAVNHALTDRWSVQASLNHTEWSTFDTLEARLESGMVLPIKEENFSNTWRGSLGATYQYSDTLTLRAGYAYDDGAVSYEHRSLSIPDTDRHWVTAGATWQLTELTTVDAGYAYIKGREADVRQQRVLATETLGNVVSTLTATESASAHILSVQVNTRF